MSRVEDDRQAQRTAERLVQEKRLQESKGKQRQEGESSFSKLVQQQKSAQAQQPPQQNLGKSVLARLQQEGKAGDLRGQQRQTGMSEGQVSGGRQPESPQTAQAKKQDQGVTQTRVESRAADAKNTSEALDKRG